MYIILYILYTHSFFPETGMRTPFLHLLVVRVGVGSPSRFGCIKLYLTFKTVQWCFKNTLHGASKRRPGNGAPCRCQHTMVLQAAPAERAAAARTGLHHPR